MVDYDYDKFKYSYGKLMDIYNSNKKELDNIFLLMSKNYKIPYQNVKDSYLRGLYAVLVEDHKESLTRKKNILRSAILYYLVMLVVFFATFFKKNKEKVETDIVFDGTHLGWYFHNYKHLDKARPKHLTSKLFIGANSKSVYKNSIQEEIKDINEIEIINRAKAWTFFEKEIAREVIKNEFFNFLTYYKLSKELNMDFVDISLRIIRSILVSYSESCNISAKYLITMGDHYYNGIRYHYFKNNGIQNIVAVQNGLRLGIYTDSFYIYCDYYYAFNEAVFDKLVGLQCKYKMVSGSIKAAIFLEQIKEYKDVIEFDVLLINHPMEGGNISLDSKEMFMQTTKYLSKYAQENSHLKINFLVKKADENVSNEYFNKIKSLMKDANATFQYSQGIDSYKTMITSKVIINLYSSLENEAYSFKKRVFNVNCNNMHEAIFKFKMEDNIGTLVDCSYENFSSKLDKLLDDNDLEVKEFYKEEFEKNKIFYDNPIQMFYDSLETKKV